MDPSIREQIIKDLDIAEFATEQQEEVIAKIGETIMRQALIDIVAALPEEKRDEFRAVAEKDDPQAMTAFLETNLPNYSQIIDNAAKEHIKRFKETKAKLSESGEKKKEN